MGNSSKTHQFVWADIRHVKNIVFCLPAIALIKWNRMEPGITPKGCGFCFGLAADFLKDRPSDTAALVVCVHGHPAQLQGTIRGFRQRRAAHRITGIIGCQYMDASGRVIDIELRGAPWPVRAQDVPPDIDEALQHLVICDDGDACSLWCVVEMYEEVAF
jgi:hypothetical protein